MPKTMINPLGLGHPILRRKQKRSRTALCCMLPKSWSKCQRTRWIFLFWATPTDGENHVFFGFRGKLSIYKSGNFIAHGFSSIYVDVLKGTILWHRRNKIEGLFHDGSEDFWKEHHLFLVVCGCAYLFLEPWLRRKSYPSPRLDHQCQFLERSVPHSECLGVSPK